MVNFIDLLPSRIKANRAPIVNNDMIEFIPLQAIPTSNDPSGIVMTNPSNRAGIPIRFAIFVEANAEKVCAGDAMISTRGNGTINSRKRNGNLIFFIKSHPNIYIMTPARVNNKRYT